MKSTKRGRRTFLQQMTLAAGAAATPDIATGKTQPPATQPKGDEPSPTTVPSPDAAALTYPRVFRGPQLKMLAFPLGGVGAGSVSLGGRGQLRDWEIFNRPDKGRQPSYAFPAIWVKVGDQPPVARVLEARILPPYEGSSGLGADNAPGLPRLASATFTGEFPLARIDFDDSQMPVDVSLEAFTPFVPHEPDESGLPAAVLRYRVTNTGNAPARVSLAFSL
ncbi:MAG: GH116 family glycosyl-hydrolase, partial [Vicinamibacteraceae bacterium]